MTEKSSGKPDAVELAFLIEEAQDEWTAESSPWRSRERAAAEAVLAKYKVRSIAEPKRVPWDSVHRPEPTGDPVEDKLRTAEWFDCLVRESIKNARTFAWMATTIRSKP